MEQRAVLFRRIRTLNRLTSMNTLFKARFLSLLILSASTIGTLSAWEEGETLPDLAAYGLEGELPEMAGKVTYVDFWASWCAPCKASFPEIERLYQENKAAGFQVLAVSVDASEPAMRRFLQRAKPSFPVVRDAAQSLVADAEIEVMPTSFLIDRKGVIRSVHLGWGGAESVQKLEGEIAALLQEMGR